MRRGFTLIETLLVISLMMLLAGVGYVLMVGVLRSQTVTNTGTVVLSQIVVAQADAYMQTNDAMHGVKLFPTEIVRFEGATYATRDVEQDVTIALQSTMVINGDDEVVFQEAVLEPVTAFSTTIQLGTNTVELTVSPYGVVDLN